MATYKNEFREQAKSDALVTAEFIELLHWLNEQGCEMKLEQVIELYREGIVVGRYWNEVLGDMQLPDDPEWDYVKYPTQQ